MAEIKTATDIVDLISSYLQLQKKGKTFLGLCPFHNDSRPSFDVDPIRQRYRCWSCGQHGDAFQFLIEHEKIAFFEAVEMLAERAGILLPEENPDRSGGSWTSDSRGLSSERWSSRSKKKDLFATLTWARQLFVKVLDSSKGLPAREYLLSRGFEPDTIERFHLGVAPEGYDFLRDMAKRNSVPEKLLVETGLLQEGEGGRLYEPFRNRVLFPIHDPLGRPIGFGGRVLDDSKPKYRNSPETAVFQKRRSLFGLDIAKTVSEEAFPLVVVEGYTDAIMACQAGFQRIVAGLGTALTEGQARLMSRFARNVCLLYDGDDAGKKAIDHGAEVCLSAGLQVSVAWLPKGMDPCDLIRERGASAFRELVLGARDYFDLFLDDAGRLPERERAELAAKLLQKVHCIEDILLRDALTRRIAEELHLTESVVRGWLGQWKDGTTGRRSEQEAGSGERISPLEMAATDLLKEALFFPHLAVMIHEGLALESLPTRPQRLVFEAILRNIGRVAHDERERLSEGDKTRGQGLSAEDIPLLLEDPEARSLVHRLLAEPSLIEEEARSRVEASLEYFRKQKAERDLASNRRDLDRALSGEGDDEEKDRVMLDYLDRLRQARGIRRSRT